MESMIKCKMFVAVNAYDLEKRINEFAEDAGNHDSKIVDIKYQAMPEAIQGYSALALYEVKGV